MKRLKIRMEIQSLVCSNDKPIGVFLDGIESKCCYSLIK